jgi:chromosome segregation ATPase
MASTPSSFDNINDELEYYKNRATELELDLTETRYALEEFQLSSKELEEELEKEIDSTERRYNEIKIRNESMRQEVEDWKVCCGQNSLTVWPHNGRQTGAPLLTYCL